jgi:hypothetical protein
VHDSVLPVEAVARIEVSPPNELLDPAVRQPEAERRRRLEDLEA